MLDLEWIRLQRWFDATAAAFDHEDARKLVSGPWTLRIEYVVRAGDGVRSARELITPALYAGWFASRAGWTHTGQAARVAGDSLDLRLGKQGQKRVTVVPKVGNDRPGSLLELEIGGTLGRVRLRREPGSDFCATTVELNRAPQTNDRPERASRVAAGGDVEVLAQALATAPRDLPFDRAVPVALAFEPR